MNEQDTDRIFIWVSIMLIVGRFLREVHCHKTLDVNVAIFSASLYRNQTRGSTKYSPTAMMYMEIMSRRIPGESQRGFSFQKTIGIWEMSECLSRSEINWIPEMLRRARSYNTVDRYSLTILTVCHQRTKRWHDLKRDKNMKYAFIYLIYFWIFLALK